MSDGILRNANSVAAHSGRQQIQTSYIIYKQDTEH